MIVSTKILLTNNGIICLNYVVVIDMQKGFDCLKAKKVVEKFNKTSELFDNVCFTMFENKKIII